MPKNSWIVIIAFLLIPGSLLGQVGSTGLSFLKLGVGGRALGMGEAYAAAAADPTAVYYNPAALIRIPDPQVLLMHKEWIQDTKIEFLGAATSLDNFSFGVGVNSTSIENIEARSLPGPPIGTFTARNAALGISAAYRLDSSLSVGATCKMLYEKILADAASGVAVDLGALYTTPWNLRLALVLDNLGSMNELDQEASRLPTIFRVGGAYQIPIEDIGGGLILSSDIVSLSDENKTHLHLGAEVNYKQVFMIRTGYQTDYDSRDFSGGIGIHYGLVRLDYAFVPFKIDLGTAHTFSLTVDFP